MLDTGKKNVIGVLVNAIDYEGAVSRIVSAAKAQQPLAVTALAVHGVVTGRQDNEQRYRLNQFDLVCPDGQPVRWALNLIHKAGLQERCYGPTLTLKTCEAAAKEGLPIYLYGSEAAVLDKLEENLIARFPGLVVAGKEPSKFRHTTAEEKVEIAERIKASGAKILFVGLGCPRQEVFVYEYRDLLPMPMLAVGAAFDFHAGNKKQPPPWMQRAGLEWFFRLTQEPKRLFKRYAVTNSVYVYRVALQALHLWKPRTDDGVAPKAELLFG